MVVPDFYPRPPRGGRRDSCPLRTGWRRFLSTPSARRATAILSESIRERDNFYPRPPRGGRQPRTVIIIKQIDFYPRPPRGGRPQSWCYVEELKDISIHALREEGDNLLPLSCRMGLKFLSTPSARRATPRHHRHLVYGHYFYPRPPRGGRHKQLGASLTAAKFLSTPSARRATAGRAIDTSSGNTDFYPRPPRGGRPQNAPARRPGRGISIHALREEGDAGLPRRHGRHPISIHALREEGDPRGSGSRRPGSISIHALREEGDCPSPREPPRAGYFYPRPPRGGRQHTGAYRNDPRQFLSTPSARRATCAACASICHRGNFYPRPPRGGRPVEPVEANYPVEQISIHALREEGDLL